LIICKQSGLPVNARSCKHLKSLLGDKYEEARMKFKNPDGPPAKGKPASEAKAKKADDEDDGNEEVDGEDGGKGEGAPALLLANKWDLEKGADPTGWWISEKLDGVRYISALAPAVYGC
jgi:DNA ligase 1